MNLALNNLQRLIGHKTQTTNQVGVRTLGENKKLNYLGKLKAYTIKLAEMMEK